LVAHVVLVLTVSCKAFLPPSGSLGGARLQVALKRETRACEARKRLAIVQVRGREREKRGVAAFIPSVGKGETPGRCCEL
jgi:hypothetical protein